MKKNKLLSALVIGGLAGAMTLVATNTANAQTDIRISGDGGAGGYDVGGKSAYANTSRTYVSDDSSASSTHYDHSYTDWVQSPLNDHIYLESGGKLTTAVTQNGLLTASGGSLIMESGSLDITSGSSVANAVNINIQSNTTANLSGTGSLGISGSGDSWAGDIVQTGGTLTIIGAVDSNVKTGSLQQSSAGNIVIGGLDSGSLVINNANDLISKSAKVTINSNGAIDISRGSVTLDNTAGSADTWSGAVALSGGELNLDSRIDLDTTTSTKTYNQSGGTLNMTGSTLDLATTHSRITDGKVNLGNASYLTIDNGSTQNAAQIVTTDDTANKLTLGTTNGAPTLKLTGNSTISKATQVNIASGTTLEIDSTTTDGVNLNGGSGVDTWAGNVRVNGGTLNISENLTKTGTLTQNTLASTTNVLDSFTLSDGDSITSGNLNLGKSDGSNNTVLSLEGTSVIGKDAIVTIEKAAELAVNGGTATINSGDNWNGTLSLGSGNLTLTGRTDTTTDTQMYKQTGGTLTLKDSSLNLATSDSRIQNGTVALTSEVTTSGGSALTFDNGLTNDAVITSNANDANSLTIGGDNSNDTTLTLNTGSDINAETSLSVSNNGILNAKGTMIKGGGSKGMTNNGIFNLSNEGDTPGTIARVLTGNDGTLNLTGNTTNTAGSSITQANINIGKEDGSVASQFTMGEDITAKNNLTVNNNSKIINAAKNIVAKTLGVKSSASIEGDGTTNGNLTVENGGYNDGTITQATIDLQGGAFENTNSLTATTELKNGSALTNSATITAEKLTNTGTIDGVTNPITSEVTYGNLVVNNGGTSSGSIIQDAISIGGAFANNAAMEAKTSLTVNQNSSLTNTSAITTALLNNKGTYTNETADSTLTANRVENRGLFTNKGTTEVATNFVNMSGKTVDNQNTINITGDLQNYGNYSNTGADSVLTANNIRNAGNFTNAGSVTVYTDFYNNDGGNVTNTNTINIIGDLKNYDTFTNSGANSRLVAKNIRNNKNFTNEGTAVAEEFINNSTGIAINKNVILADTLTNYNDYQNDGTGSVLISNLINNKAGTFSNEGIVAGAIVDEEYVQGNLAINNDSGATFTNHSTGAILADSITNNGTANNAGTIIANTIANNAGTFANTGIIAGGFDDNGDPIQDDLAISNASGATFTNHSNSAIIADSITNEGTANNAGAIIANTVANNAGTFKNSGMIAGGFDDNGDPIQDDLAITNASGAEFTNHSSGDIIADSITNEGTANNSGDIIANAIANNAGTFKNSGIIAGGVDDSGAPIQDDLAITNASGATFTNHSAGDIYADSITNEGTATNSGDIVANAIANNAGTFKNSGVIAGGFDANGDPIQDDLAITNASGAEFTNHSSGDIYAHSITNEGTATNSGDIVANAIANNAGTFKNSGVIAGGFDANGDPIQDDLAITNASGAEFTNHSSGDIYAHSVTNEGTANNAGYIIANAIANDAGTFTNTGLIAGGFDDNDDPIPDDLAITNASGAEFTNHSTGEIYAHSITNEGTANNAGYIIANAIANDAGTFANTGLIAGGFDANGDPIQDDLAITNASGAEFTNHSSGDIYAHSVTNEGTANNAGYIIANAIANDAGTFTNTGLIAGGFDANGDPIQDDLAITNASGATFTNDSTGEIYAHSIANEGTANNAGTVIADTIDNNAGTFTSTGLIAGGFDDNGNPIQDDLAITNASGATFTNDSTGEIYAHSIANEGTANNAGTVIADTIDNNAGTFTNTGLIAGGLDSSGNPIQDDLVVTNANGAQFTNEAAGNIYADIVANDGTATNAGNIIANAILNNSTGTFENNGTATAYDWFANEGIVTGTGTLNASDGYSDNTITQGTLNIADNNIAFDNNASLTLTDALNVGAGSTLNNSSDILVADADNNDAMLTNNGTINTTADSTITADKLTNDNGVINMTKAKVAIVYQSDDIKGVVNVLGTNAANDVSDLTITGTQPNFAGTMNIGNVADASIKSTLNLKSGNILEEAALTIAKGNVLNVDGTNSSVVVDSSDTYAGDLILTDGAVKMKGLNITTGDKSTTAGGNKPYYAQTGGKLTLENTTLSMTDSSKISGGDMLVQAGSRFNSLSNAFTLDNLTNGGVVNAINNAYENYAVSDNLLAGDNISSTQGNFTTDLYARSNNNKKYDSYGSDTATLGAANGTNGTFHISDWSLHGDLNGWDAPVDRHIKLDNFFKGHVAANQDINFTATDKEVLTPIGWYRLNSTGAGNYSFDLSRFNPQVFRGQVTKIAQYQNQLMIDDMLFNHTMLDQGFKGNDYIASHPNRYASSSDLFPPYQYSRKDGGLWVKMYGTFEKLQMSQGLHVGNNAYGTIIGADFGLKDLRNGWQFMPTAYIAYNGAHQYWNGAGAYQNGGQAGFMGTWYKDNFIIGALAYGGVYGNEMDTPRGTDETLGYFAGGSAKAAYNWRFARDWSLQPNFLVAYNFFGKENWHTDFGQMGMMSGMLNGINIAPGLNLIWEKETFSTYATIQYMYNINQSVGGRAGNVGLPNVSMNRGYIQYGIGVNKRFSDRFSGFFQAVIRNVGRNGIGLQAGFQWQLGKTGSNYNTPQRDVTPEAKKSAIILNNHKVQ